VSRVLGERIDTSIVASQSGLRNNGDAAALVASCATIADDVVERLAVRADGLRTWIAATLADRPGVVLLFVDQFAELFTHCQEGPERCRQRSEQFVVNLADAVRKGDDRIRVVITLRADFLDRCLVFGALRELLEERQVLLGPQDEDALREVIVRPAQAVGALFEKGLVGMILRDVAAETGALPLLVGPAGVDEVAQVAQVEPEDAAGGGLLGGPRPGDAHDRTLLAVDCEHPVRLVARTGCQTWARV
jgi:hypothetical protein